MEKIFVCEFCKSTYTSCRTLMYHKKHKCCMYKNDIDNKNINAELTSENAKLNNNIQELENEIQELKKEIQRLKDNFACCTNDTNIDSIVYYLNKNNIQPLGIQKMDNMFLSNLFPDFMVIACSLAKLNNHKLAIQWIIDEIYYIYSKENPKEQNIWTADKSTYIMKMDINNNCNWTIDKNGEMFQDFVVKPILNYIYNGIVKIDISTGFAQEIQRNNSQLHDNKYISKCLLNLNEISFNILLKTNPNESIISKYIKEYGIKTYNELRIFAEKFEKNVENTIGSSVQNATYLTKIVKKEYNTLLAYMTTNSAYEYVLKCLSKKFKFKELIFEHTALFNQTIKPSRIMSANEILIAKQQKMDSMIEYKCIREDIPDFISKTIEYIKNNYVSDIPFGIDSLLKDIDMSIIESISDYDVFIKYVAQKMYENIKQTNIKDNYLWNVSNIKPYFICRCLCKDKTLQWKEDPSGLFVKKHFFDANINFLKAKCLEYDSDNAIIIDILDPDMLTRLYLTLCQYFAELCFIKI